jgi:hypothetical protein
VHADRRTHRLKCQQVEPHCLQKTTLATDHPQCSGMTKKQQHGIAPRLQDEHGLASSRRLTPWSATGSPLPDAVWLPPVRWRGGSGACVHWRPIEGDQPTAKSSDNLLLHSKICPRNRRQTGPTRDREETNASTFEVELEDAELTTKRAKTQGHEASGAPDPRFIIAGRGRTARVYRIRCARLGPPQFLGACSASIMSARTTTSAPNSIAQGSTTRAACAAPPHCSRVSL